MLNLKRKFQSKRRRSSASSSTAGSVSDADGRVVMLCEDVPNENSSEVFHNAGTRLRGSSLSEENESESEPSIFHLSRDRLSYRRACYVEREPAQHQREYYIQRVVKMYCTKASSMCFMNRGCNNPPYWVFPSNLGASSCSLLVHACYNMPLSSCQPALAVYNMMVELWDSCCFLPFYTVSRDR